MKIDTLTPDTEMLKELGERLARIRKQQRLSQTELAEEAGIGVATLRRIEGGQDSQLVSWLKLLRALGMTTAIESLLPEEFSSPMAEVRGTTRKRAKTPSDKTPAGIVWGDEAP